MFFWGRTFAGDAEIEYVRVAARKMEYGAGMFSKTFWLGVAVVLMACPTEAPRTPGDTTGAPGLQCPGATQCPPDGAGNCAPGMLLGPNGACTVGCVSARECPRVVSGETCLAGLCAVSCDPDILPSGGCQDAGMPGAICTQREPGTPVCGYD